MKHHIDCGLLYDDGPEACTCVEDAPDLLEAREVCAQHSEANEMHAMARWYRDGSHDDFAFMRLAIAAIKRGRELERAAIAGDAA